MHTLGEVLHYGFSEENLKLTAKAFLESRDDLRNLDCSKGDDCFVVSAVIVSFLENQPSASLSHKMFGIGETVDEAWEDFCFNYIHEGHGVVSNADKAKFKEALHNLY